MSDFLDSRRRTTSAAIVSDVLDKSILICFRSVNVILGLAIPGVALSVLLLAAIAFLQWNPVSRPYLDRVSFRLLVYALIGNVIFGAVMLPPMKGSSPGCTLISFLYATAPMFSAALFCSMAVNLQLVLIHGVNGNKMEKYYLLAAAFLCAACNIPPLAAGIFGWYAPAAKCWLTPSIPAVQQHWMIGTQSVPMILMSAIEVVCKDANRNLRIGYPCVDPSRTSNRAVPPEYPPHRLVPASFLLFKHNRVCPQYIHQYTSAPNSLYFQYEYTDIECAYPTADILSPAMLMYVPIVDSCVYSVRPLMYALLAATDPSFLRAIRSLRHATEIEPSSQWVSSPRSHSQTATAVSAQWASKQELKKSSETSIITDERSDLERGPSTAEEARTEEEILYERIPHQL
ncbi:hypothetical protein B0H13DRAFT_2653957 [Mycena leptocephala]|nr:hypothetical protein B0H13DRAFT_2653957 [Mycena leptocephala]